MSPLDILRAARERITDPARYTTHTYARTETGGLSLAGDERAVKWSGYGAVYANPRASLLMDRAVAWNALHDQLALDMDAGIIPTRGSFVAFCDHPDTRHEDVLALYTRAIERLEAARAAAEGSP